MLIVRLIKQQAKYLFINSKNRIKTTGMNTMEEKTTDSHGKEKEAVEHEIRISAPWGSNITQTFGRGTRGNSVDTNHFLTERSRVHEAYIREQEKTKRLSLFLSALLLLVACLLFVFAPEGREQVSNWIGAAFLVTAAGAAGYKRIWGRTKNMSFGADHGKDSNKA